MVRKVKPADAKASADEGAIDRADFQRDVAELQRQDKIRGEYQSNLANGTQRVVEKYGLEKTAFTFVRRLAKMEPAKRQAVLRGVITYADLLAYFDQLDAFDDLRDTLGRILDREPEAPSPNTNDAVVAALLN
jgi:hypothetical protein